MHRDQLSLIPGMDLAPPADAVALAVADALLPAPIPPALVEFLNVCDGARVEEVEIFNAERIAEATNEGAHSWQLPGALIIGSAGAGRALMMRGVRDEVSEVDDDPWDADSERLAADAPLDLFIRHRGLPLRARERWWAHPPLGEAIEESRRRLLRDVEALSDLQIGARVGEALAPSLAGFQRVDVAQLGSLPTSDDYNDQLLNYRPEPPAPGLAVRAQWQEACAAILDSSLRERILGAPLSRAIPELDRLVGDGDRTVADEIRSDVLLALVAKARDELAALATGEPCAQLSPVGRLAQVYLAGHVPVSLDSAI